MDTASQKSVDEINLVDKEHYQQLTAPSIPAAIYDEDHSGLLPISLLNQPLRVELIGWPGIAATDSYQLLLNGTLIGEVKTTTTELPLDPLFLEVPVDYLLQDVFAVAYRATNTQNGIHADSATARLEIVTTPPGLPMLAPMKFPDEIEGGLTSAELTEMGDVLVAEVGSYTGMYQHDVIRTFWGDTEGPGAVVIKTDMGINRIKITYTRAFLQSLGDFDGLVTYTVKDRAGNISQPSLGTHIKLLISNPCECLNDVQPNPDTHSARYSDSVVDITVRLQSTLSNNPSNKR